MVASRQPLGRKESLIEIVARRLSSKQRPSRLGEEDNVVVEEENMKESVVERKQSLVDILAARFSRTPRQLKVGAGHVDGDLSDDSGVEGTPET